MPTLFSHGSRKPAQPVLGENLDEAFVEMQALPLARPEHELVPAKRDGGIVVVTGAMMDAEFHGSNFN